MTHLQSGGPLGPEGDLGQEPRSETAGLCRLVRVVQLWDDERTIGHWFTDQEDYRELIFGPLAWDIYFLYGPEARWGNAPSPLVGSGFTIIGKRKALQSELLALLSRS